MKSIYFLNGIYTKNHIGLKYQYENYNFLFELYLLLLLKFEKVVEGDFYILTSKCFDTSCKLQKSRLCANLSYFLVLISNYMVNSGQSPPVGDEK